MPNPLRDIELHPGIFVSRETQDRLQIYHDLVVRWQKKINLISNLTVTNIWTRHIADSVQLFDLAPRARGWADLGSGGGFPGLVIAILIAEQPNSVVHLIDSDTKKCVFLREAIRTVGASAVVHRGRIEDVIGSLDVNVVTARALAPLNDLIRLAMPVLSQGAIGVFPRGGDIQNELTALTRRDSLNIEVISSKIDPASGIAVVRMAGFDRQEQKMAIKRISDRDK